MADSAFAARQMLFLATDTFNELCNNRLIIRDSHGYYPVL